jgi:LemA protein
MSPITLILVIAAAALLGVVVFYNRFVSLGTRADASWADIDALLKQRYDMIPNLVETVKGYAAHESKTFEAVTKWRSASMNAQTPVEKAQAENQLAGVLKTLFAVAENYPELKANQNFMKLQGTLEQVENNIQGSRRYYNAVVRDYNVAIKTFPGLFIARQFNFAPREFFELTNAAEREAPKVQF